MVTRKSLGRHARLIVSGGWFVFAVFGTAWGQDPLIPILPPDAPPLEPLHPVTSPAPVPRIEGAETLPGGVIVALHEGLAEWIAASIPPVYENDRQWGKTKEVYAGFKLRPDGFRLETERRWKSVNHGSWHKYRAELLDPRQHARVQVQPLVRDERGRFRFDIKAQADLKLWGRWSQWNYGVQLISLSGVGQAIVELHLQGDVGFRLTGDGLIPDLVVDPHVQSARLSLLSFKLQDISDIEGEFAKQVGRGLNHWLQDEWIPELNNELTDKLNRKVEQKRDRLRISADRWIQDWFASKKE